MDLPANTNLPFFAYGIFKRGQISHFRIKEYVKQLITSVSVNGLLHIRDGITIIDTKHNDKTVTGNLIYFKDNQNQLAYQQISDLEPKKYYKWGVVNTEFGEANILLGINPTASSTEYVDEWDSWKDALFTVSFEIIDETIKKSTQDDAENGKQFLRLQMAYLLLWSAIERFVALRYNFRGEHVMNNVYKLAEEPIFAKLLQNTKNHRALYSTDNVDKNRKFNKENPLSCIKYYYQLRSNITHRGKASVTDAILVNECLTELTDIFKALLVHAKENS
jgi:hypothetical protein